MSRTAMNVSAEKTVLRIGKIDFLNTLPFFYSWKPSCAKIDLVSGHPAALNDKLVGGEIDASISSSLLYARYPGEFLILPDLCIGASRASQSVILFSEVPVESLSGKTVGLSAKSYSAASLVRILLRSVWKVPCSCEASALEPAKLKTRYPAYLLIGDEALFLRARPNFSYDLSEMWWKWKGFPFCFALWLVRKSFVEKHPVAVRSLYENLVKNVDANRAHLGMLIGGWDLLSQKDREVAADYLGHLEYRLDENMRRGLELFFESAFDAGLISEVPPLRFASVHS